MPNFMTINGKRLVDYTIEELNSYFVGKKFNKITICGLYKKEYSHRLVVFADYICECGTKKSASLRNILTNNVKSCGCLRRHTMQQNQKMSVCNRIVNRDGNRYTINNDMTVSVFSSNNPNIVYTVDLYSWIWLSTFTWYSDSNGYMVTQCNGETFRYHTLLLPVPPNSKYVRDHISRNHYDNRYINLRVVLQKNNTQNIGIPKSNTSGYRGVLNYADGKYRAFISGGNKTIRKSKVCNTLEEALFVRKQWEKEYFILDELEVPPLFLPNGCLNVYNFPFNWYPNKYILIWSLLGIKVVPYPLELSRYIDNVNYVFKKVNLNENI